MNFNSKHRQLAKAAKKGNPESMRIILEHFRPSLYATALKLLGDGEKAKDAIQDTYITALTKIDQLRDEAAIKHWLHTILKNHCRMYQRKSQIEFCEGAGWDDLPDKPIQASVLQQLDEKRCRESILKSLSELPEKLRVPLLLRYFSNFSSYQHIANVLGVPVGTVRSRLSRAKEKLLKKFNNGAADFVRTGSPFLSNDREDQYADAIEEFYRGNRKQFLTRFSEDLRIRFTSGKEVEGRQYWALEWEEDLESGVRFQPNQILSSGHITLMEGAFKNPPHDPYHCPPAGTFVLFHYDGKVYRVHIHYGDWVNSNE